MNAHQEKSQVSTDIVKLDPREHVRLRPGMYIGGTGQRALHQLVYEVVDHSAELASAGQCDHIWVTFRDNNEVCVQDNGREIPVDIDKATGRPLLEIFMSQIGVSNERVHGFPENRYTGLHSTGLWAVNFLSEQLSIEATYNGYMWRQEYHKGISKNKLTQIRVLKADEARGVSITFRPDFTIFEANTFDYDAIVEHSLEIAYLASGVTITVVDERKSPALNTEFHFPNGMADVVKNINEGQSVLHKIIYHRGQYTAEAKNRYETFEVEFALQYTNSSETVIKSYVNTWCMDGGTHVRGLESAMVRVINAKVGSQIERPFTWEEVKGGLTVGLNVKLVDPQFESQTRIVLINPLAFDAVAEVVYKGMNGQMLDAIIKKCKANQQAAKNNKYGAK